jgi:hypothetical protein
VGTHFAWIRCTAAQLYILLALCKYILYGILLSVVHTHCLVQFDVKLDYIYTHLRRIHCAWIISTPVQDLNCFVETRGAHTLLVHFAASAQSVVWNCTLVRFAASEQVCLVLTDY